MADNPTATQDEAGPAPDAGARAAATPAHPPPLFILGAPRSFTSLVCAMIGQHPQAFGFPELNLFVAPSVDELIETMSGYRQIQLHGMLRTVAHLYAGEQTLIALDMARRWLVRRLDRDTADVFAELCARVAPLHAVDKSPAYAVRPQSLERMRRAFPDAYYLHLTRNPKTQGESMLKLAHGIMLIGVDSIDYSTDPPTVDPQISWLQLQRNILDHLAGIPLKRQLRLRGEDIVARPVENLRRICRWLEIADDKAALDRMMRPEDSPFACLGPFGAQLGNDIGFLKSPALRRGRVPSPRLGGPLPWRPDRAGFKDEVLAMAHELGYQ